MSTRRFLLISFAALAIAVSPAFAGSAMKGLDTDADETLDLAEAKKAAGDLFDKLDKDHEGTLDARELPCPIEERRDRRG